MSVFCFLKLSKSIVYVGRFVRLCSSSKTKTKSALANYTILNSPEVEKKLTPFRLAADEQAQVVRNLKEKKATSDELNKAITELKNRKQLLQKKEQELNPQVENIDKEKLDDLLKQRFFYDQSFSIYGGAQGLYDFGPAGSALKANLLQDWRKFFVLSDGMLEVTCPVLTPESVLRASGHVDRFTDFLVSDSLTGESYRADHLLRHSLGSTATAAGSSVELRAEALKALSGLDSLDEDGLQALIDRFIITAPHTGNPLTPLRRFNLMFETSAGAGAADCQQQQQPRHRFYLRPETAQGMFTNFRRLLSFNRGRLPMAVAQVGSSFRNEIQPRSGLIRLREFTLAEIEHFYDPLDSCHPDFASVASLSLPLLTAANQSSSSAPTWLKLDSAVASGLLANETLAYYLARIHLFLTSRCGIDARRLRFRQHPPGEMAHYASDCWDAECLVSSGDGELAWVECVGCADRSAYDLTRHSEASRERLVATRASPTGTGNAGDSPEVFTPSVVEPSFGIGRILTATLEHNFRRRSNDSSGRRTYLSLPAWLAPYHCALLPMSAGSDEMRSLAKQLAKQLARLGLASWLDSDARSVSIGKRYARSDQLGVPFAVTIDFDTMAEASALAARDAGGHRPTVTLRERDTMLQVRVQISEVADLVAQLVAQSVTWQQVMDSHTVFRGQTSSGRVVDS